MRRLMCEGCGQEYPMNETFSMEEHVVCNACSETFKQSHEDSIFEIKKCQDPTICILCGADNGDESHEQVFQKPTCQTCAAQLRNRPYPLWVKAFFVGILLLVVFSFIWNYRFLRAYFGIRAAFAAISEHRVSDAAACVPEVRDIQEFANYFQGVDSLTKDDCENAEAYLSKCSHLPGDFGIFELKREAAIGAAFKRKDYHRFAQLAEEMAKKEPQSARAQAQWASALACLYAVEGAPKWREQSEAKLQEAKKLNNQEVETMRYGERIRHRLDTREIISADEYFARFPEPKQASEETQP